MLDWLERTTDERNFPAHLLSWANEAEEWLRAALTNEPGGVTISLEDAQAIVAGISDNPKFPKALALRGRLSAAIGERG
jgi:hypothetical protein